MLVSAPSHVLWFMSLRLTLGISIGHWVWRYGSQFSPWSVLKVVLSSVDGAARQSDTKSKFVALDTLAHDINYMRHIKWHWGMNCICIYKHSVYAITWSSTLQVEGNLSEMLSFSSSCCWQHFEIITSHWFWVSVSKSFRLNVQQTSWTVRQTVVKGRCWTNWITSSE